MPVSSPLPSNLPKECRQAAQIFSSFSSIIPSEILRGARGFAILTIAKAGFLFSARAGSGVVLVKLQNGAWSAPSAIGTGGLGVGGQAGAELSEFVIILNSKAAVQSFMTAGSINLGGNLSVAVGPVGRNAEASGSLNKFSTMYSYSRTRGLFGGASLEGSVIFERSDANVKAYSPYVDSPHEISARNILSGQIEVPPWAGLLVQAIERKVGTMFDSTWIDDAPSEDESGRRRGYSFGTEGIASQSSSNSPTTTAGSSRNRLERLQTDTDSAGNSGGGGKGSRLRGYSLGSFGRSKSGSGASTPSRGGTRDRAYSSAAATDPQYRFREEEADDDEEEAEANSDEDRYRDFNPSASTRSSRRSSSRTAVHNNPYADDDGDDYQVPASPSSTVSSTSRSQRFTEFMKRPVMPSRKSTSAISTASANNYGRDSPSGTQMQRGSPLSGRSRSGTLASNISGKSHRKGRLEYSGRYSSSDEEGEGEGEGEFASMDRREDGRGQGVREEKASPFADRFGEVEHRFSENEEEEEDNERNGKGSYSKNARDRSNSGSTNNNRYSDKSGNNGRNRSGSSGITGILSSSLSSRPKLPKRSSSTTAGAAAAGVVSATTSAVKGVFKARPLTKRSATAPVPRGNTGNNGRDRNESWSNRRGGVGIGGSGGGYRDDEYGSGEDENRNEGSYNTFGRDRDRGHNEALEDLDDILVMRPSDGMAGSSRRSSGTPGEGSDTEEERERAQDIRIQRPDNPFAESPSGSRRSGRGNVEAEGGFFSSTRENRDIMNDLRNYGGSDGYRNHSSSSLSSAETLERTRATHPSASASTDIYANRRAFIQQTEADFQSQSGGGGGKGGGKGTEYRMALFDFQGAESGDLSFKTGDVIEILAKEDPDWWMGRMGGREGIVPVNRTKAYKP